MTTPRSVKTNSPVTIGGISTEPGARQIIDLPVANLYTHEAVHMPVQVVNGLRPGPTLLVCAAVHGDEINGVEVIRRLLAYRGLDRMRGTLLAVPIVNVHGFLHQMRYLPDRRDLNRSFPGSETGSVAARLAHLFTEEILEKADCGIDIHTGALHRSNLPQIRADLDDAATLELARAFGVPVIINANLRDGSLREAAASRGIPSLLYEAGEALRFDEVGIRAGLRGVQSVMRALDMLPARKTKARTVDPVMARETRWLRAPTSGIVRAHTTLGQRVQKGDVLATLSDPFGESENVVIATFAGIVIGCSNLPLAHEGDALFHVAAFEKLAVAETAVDEFQTQNERVPEASPPSPEYGRSS
jgi:predicted deacylase